jgi:hypothetical protein
LPLRGAFPKGYMHLDKRTNCQSTPLSERNVVSRQTYSGNPRTHCSIRTQQWIHSARSSTRQWKREKRASYPKAIAKRPGRPLSPRMDAGGPTQRAPVDPFEKHLLLLRMCLFASILSASSLKMLLRCRTVSPISTNSTARASVE